MSRVGVFAGFEVVFRKLRVILAQRTYRLVEGRQSVEVVNILTFLRSVMLMVKSAVSAARRDKRDSSRMRNRLEFNTAERCEQG